LCHLWPWAIMIDWWDTSEVYRWMSKDKTNQR
jgi:hypothetical protein